MEILPVVSIITPVFNGSEYLENLILSVRDQDFAPIEHIIIDDGSNDGGATIAILNKYPHLRWWSLENRGQYRAMNEGLLMAKGKFVCFISADDLLAQQAVSQTIHWFTNHPGYEAVYGLTAYQSEIDQSVKVNRLVPYASLKFYPYLPHQAQFQHCSFFISREALINRDLWFNPNLKYAGDYDWIIRILQKRIRVGYLNEVLSTVRMHENQISILHRVPMAKEKLQVAQSHGIRGLELQYFLKMIRNRLLGMG